MTQQEFETRTGLTVSASEFDFIHRVYMAAGSLGKDDFCKEWKASYKAIRTSAILCAIVEENEQNVGYIGSLQSQLKREKENFKAIVKARKEAFAQGVEEGKRKAVKPEKKLTASIHRLHEELKHIAAWEGVEL